MRKLVLIVAVTAACSSAPTTGTTTPSYTPGVPASITIVSGDGQSAVPGTALPITLAVVVKDGGGAVVAGAVVHFAVDSGGGSLSVTTATTDSSGTAAGGTWTLGSTVMTNVVSVTVATVPAVRLHAQAIAGNATTVFSGAMTGAGGGTLTYQKPGDPLNGLSLTVASGAYPGPVAWTVVADPTVQAPLPPGFSQVGPSLAISNQQGYADSLMTLTVPMHVPDSMALAPFYYDITSGALEPIPLVDRTDSSATLATRHFNGGLMALPSNNTAGLRLQPPPAFGTFRVVWIQLPVSQLLGTWTSGFTPGVDDWEFINYGDWLSPDGDCFGMSATAIYYYFYHRSGANSGRPGLYHQFDSLPDNPWDNVQGIHYAASIQADYGDNQANIDALQAQLQARAVAKGTNVAALTWEWIALTIKLNRQPAGLSLYSATSGHEVVAYAVTVTSTGETVFVADPNHPGIPSTIQFNHGVLVPSLVATSANATPRTYTTVLVEGVAAIMPLANFASRYREFIAGAAGRDRFPDPGTYSFAYFDAASNSWNPVIDTIRISDPLLKVGLLCPTCTVPVPGASPASLQQVAIFDETGLINLVSDGTKVGLPVQPGVSKVTLLGVPLSPNVAGRVGFLDFAFLPVKFSGISILPTNHQLLTATPITFVASNGGEGTPGSTYLWTFGDGTPGVTVTGDSTVTHTYSMFGPVAVHVVMRNADSTLFGSAAIVDTLSGLRMWQLTAVGAPLETLPSGGLANANDSSLHTRTVTTFTNLVQTPAANLIVVSDSADCGGANLEQFASAFAVDISVRVSQQAIATGFLARNCGLGAFSDTGTFSIGPMGAGALNGTVVEVAPPFTGSLPGGAISATMSANQLQGSFTINSDYSTGIGKTTVTFTALQVRP